MFNWRTRGLDAGTCQILLTLNDGTTYTTTVPLGTDSGSAGQVTSKAGGGSATGAVLPERCQPRLGRYGSPVGVLFGAADHHLYVLDRRTGQKLWSFRADDYCVRVPPVVHGGRVFCAQ